MNTNTPSASLARIPRRAALQLAGVAGIGAALGTLPGCSNRDSSGGQPTVPPTPTSGTNTPGTTDAAKEIWSENGLLKATLKLAPAMVPVGSRTRWALTVNGQTPGPTLRAKPGDRLAIALDNQSGHPTNLHTHGLGVSPTGNADNPFLEIPNGTTFNYEIDIPADHPGGTFWYHPHFHHHVAEQLFAGFFGMIVVEDAVDRLPEIAAATERLVMLHDTRIATTEAGVLNATQMAMRDGREGDVFVNGVQQPVFEGRPDRLERWRILNASPSRFYRLKLDGHAFHLIATDANRLAAPARLDEITMVPGERIEVLVQHSSEGTFALKALPVDRGAMSTNPEMTLASVKVQGGGTAPALPARIGAFTSLNDVRPAFTREVVFSMQGQMGGPRFLIDGKEFDGNRIDVKVAKGTTEDWVVRNTSPMDHPFHLHVWPFQVIEQPGGNPLPAWKDTVNIPANSSLRLRIPFIGITGKTVFHCHILDHEDNGMMAIIEVA